ncbi:MAG: hypothetical protein HQL92_05820 [Magnetococcales bacterium]|nr:hypothetical protein [Magnetococcales bacterium]
MRANIHQHPTIRFLSIQARWLFFCVHSLAAGTGGADTGFKVAEVLLDSMVGPEFLEEATSAGVLTITEAGTVALADGVLPLGTVSKSTERVRQFRGRKKAAESPAEPQAITESPQSEPAAFVVPVPPPPPEQPPAPPLPVIHDKSPLVTQEDKALIFPEQVASSEQAILRNLLAGLQMHQAQMVLDELAGNLMAGKVINNRTGWVRSIAGRVTGGAFVPELGIAVAEHRRQVRIMASVRPPDPPPVPSFDDSLTKITNPAFADILWRIKHMYFPDRVAA